MPTGNFTELVLVAPVKGTDNLDGTITITLNLDGNTSHFLRGDGAWAAPAGGGGDPATDTKVWMPLSTTVGGEDVLVYDASHQLIPTLTPI
jgi:hypothetical protein